MSLTLVLEVTLACVLASAGGTGLALIWLRRRQIMDHPNERSSHDQPTPRGGGLAVVPVVLIAWAVLAILNMVPWWILGVVAAAGALAYVSWRDDRGGLRVTTRLATQCAAVAVGMVCLWGSGHLWGDGKGLVFQGLLPVWLDILATALTWVWFVNLFNFMDGIDGITASESLVIGVGVALVAWFTNDYDSGRLWLGLALAAAAVGFLPWNWQPARIFLGDVGSVPLGFLGGWLLLSLAAHGDWAPALILPLYYLIDSTLTLLYRGVRFRRVWEAHREHFYQRAVQGGMGHGAVVLRIFAANLGLVGLALLATRWPLVGLGLAVVLVTALIVYLLRHRPSAPPIV